jgi:cytoskeletal protein RodZ
MRNSSIKSELLKKYFRTLSIRLVLIIIVSGLLGISSFDLTYNNITAQTLQEKCLPDMGTNVSKSSCFSNTPTEPTYNVTNTDNARPPSESTTTYSNNTNTNTNTSAR